MNDNSNTSSIEFTHASLFTGIGVFDLAAEEVGWKNVFQVEIDEWCNTLLQNRFPTAQQFKDIRDFDGKKYRHSINVLSGGFPCQDISVSGGGEGIVGKKSSLWNEYGRIIQEALPEYAVIENSPNLTRKGFEKILYDLAEIGYDAEWETFFASEFGKYHHRGRLYILAYSNVQRRRGILHHIKRRLAEENKKADSLDSQCHPFLQFEQRFGEPAVFRMADGLAKRLDVIKRMGACGNAVVKDIPLAIFKEINQINNENRTT